MIEYLRLAFGTFVRAGARHGRRPGAADAFGRRDVRVGARLRLRRLGGRVHRAPLDPPRGGDAGGDHARRAHRRAPGEHRPGRRARAGLDLRGGARLVHVARREPGRGGRPVPRGARAQAGRPDEPAPAHRRRVQGRRPPPGLRVSALARLPRARLVVLRRSTPSRSCATSRRCSHRSRVCWCSRRVSLFSARAGSGPPCSRRSSRSSASGRATAARSRCCRCRRPLRAS